MGRADGLHRRGSRVHDLKLNNAYSHGRLKPAHVHPHPHLHPLAPAALLLALPAQVAYSDEMASVLQQLSPVCIHILAGTNTDRCVGPPPAGAGGSHALAMGRTLCCRQPQQLLKWAKARANAPSPLLPCPRPRPPRPVIATVAPRWRVLPASLPAREFCPRASGPRGAAPPQL